MTAPAIRPLLAFEGIEKRFFGVPVLKGISFAVGTGRTLGLVGENGAGKSTLMNVLGGNLRPDAGRLFLDEQPFAPRNPLDAAARGVAFIHQELNLFGNLSIAENLFLTTFPRIGSGLLPLIDRAAIRRQTTALLGQVGLAADPDSPVDALAAGERQLVEIAKALAGQARLILFDEPTTSLTAREADRLFRLMGALRQRGVTMIYISHNLGDVLRLCDEVVVLRDGAVVGQGPREAFTLDSMVSLMVGRDLAATARTPSPPSDGGEGSPKQDLAHCTPEPGGDGITITSRRRSTDSAFCLLPSAFPVPGEEVTERSLGKGGPMQDIALEVKGVSQPGVVRGISFRLHGGEVLGLAGLMGSGRSELARILFGLDPHAAGEIVLHGKPFRPSPRAGIRRGLAFLTENRRDEGLCLEASIAENMALVSLPRHTRSGWVNEAGLLGLIRRWRQAVRLTASARDGQPVKTLSGGNQQKVVLAKWLMAEPSVFILDEPTRGIDVGARYEIYGLIRGMAARGAGVLLISSEIEELIGLCDRILVMRAGEIRDEVRRPDFDRERILRSALQESARGKEEA